MSDGSGQTFKERVEEIREERDNGEVSAEDIEKPVHLIVTMFVIGGVIGLIFAQSDHIQSGLFLAVLFSGVTWLFVTESGKALREEISDHQQQHQKSSNVNEPKKICKSCGWQNNPQNTYCNDCGEELPGS